MKSELWKDLPHKGRVLFQLQQDRLCIPIGEFKKSLNIVLNRDVYTYELANRDDLLKEVVGDKIPPSIKEIIEMIPEEKRIILH